jgi:1-acyl-sn-glycerol-3-phosphate acyltransferase
MNIKLYFVLPFLLQATLWRIVMRPLFYVFAKFEVRCFEHVAQLPRGVVFAPNHTSELDSVVLPLAFPLWSRFSPMFYIVRAPKFYTDPVFSWRRHFYDLVPFNALGAFAIVSGIKDYARSLSRHASILTDGGSICIFPEGSFTKTGAIGDAHGGVSYLAHTAQKPVVPVLIEGTRSVTFSNLIHRRCKIILTFLPPLYAHAYLPASPSADEYRAFARIVLNTLRDERVRVHAEEVREVTVPQKINKPAKLHKI